MAHNHVHYDILYKIDVVLVNCLLEKMGVAMVTLRTRQVVVDQHHKCVKKMNICHHDLIDVRVVQNEQFQMRTIQNVSAIQMKNVVEYN